jgi:hypothetical protein
MKTKKLDKNKEELAESKSINANDVMVKLIKDCTNPDTGIVDEAMFKAELKRQIDLFDSILDKEDTKDAEVKSIINSVTSINDIEEQKKARAKKTDKQIVKDLVTINDQDEYIEALNKSLHNAGEFLDFQTIFKFASKNEVLRNKFKLNENYSKLDVYSLDLIGNENEIVNNVDKEIESYREKESDFERNYFSSLHNHSALFKEEIVSKIKTNFYGRNLGIEDNQLSLSNSNLKPILENIKISNELLSSLIVDKYFYGLTSYKMSNRLNLIGFDLSIKDFDESLGKIAKNLKIVSDEILESLLKEDKIVLSESPIDVISCMKNQEFSNTWMICITTAIDEKKVVYYIYRKGIQLPNSIDEIVDFKGLVDSDWMRPYLNNTKNSFQVSLECDYLKMAFEDCLEMDECTEGSSIETTSKRILRIIEKINFIDKSLRLKIHNKDLDGDNYTQMDFLKERKAQSLVQFEKLRKIAEGRMGYHVMDESVSTNLSYILNNYEFLLKYLDYPNLAPYSIYSKRLIKTINESTFNSIYCLNDEEAKNFAIMETIIENANLNDLDMVNYLTYLLDEIANEKINKNNASSYIPYNLSEELKESLKVGVEVNKVARLLNY